MAKPGGVPDRFAGKITVLTGLTQLPLEQLRTGSAHPLSAYRAQDTDYSVVPETLAKIYNRPADESNTGVSGGPIEFQNYPAIIQTDSDTFATNVGLKKWTIPKSKYKKLPTDRNAPPMLAEVWHSLPEPFIDEPNWTPRALAEAGITVYEKNHSSPLSNLLGLGQLVPPLHRPDDRHLHPGRGRRIRAGRAVHGRDVPCFQQVVLDRGRLAV
jgi:hypothetical protein